MLADTTFHFSNVLVNVEIIKLYINALEYLSLIVHID